MIVHYKVLLAPGSAMRILLCILTFGLLLVCSTVAGQDGQYVVRVDEGCRSGHVVADLRDVLELADAEFVRYVVANGRRFQLDADERLLFVGAEPLDFEAGSEYLMLVDVATLRSRDRVRERFTDLIKKAGADTTAIEEFQQTQRTVAVRILVEDVNEHPRLLSESLWTVAPSDMTRAGALGRVIGADPDRDDTLRFRFTKEHPFLHIDSHTGVVFLREDAEPPALSKLTAVVAVSDARGLTHRQSLEVRLNQAPANLFELRDVHTLVADNPQTTADGEPISASAVEPEPTAARMVATAGADLTAQTEGSILAQDVLQDAQAIMVEQIPPTGTTLGKTEQSASRTPLVYDASSRWRWTWLALLAGASVSVVLCGRKLLSLFCSSGRRHPLEAAAKSPSEVDAILSRLDNFRAELDDKPAWEQPAGISTTDNGSIDDFMIEVLAGAGLSSEAAAATATVPQQQTQQKASPSRAERERLEQFRAVSRSNHRAELRRRNRERMIQDWKSVGVTAIGCMLTGSVCLLTQFLGPLSVPLGTVLLSAAAALLIRRSLYPVAPRSDSDQRLDRAFGRTSRR